MWAGQPVPPPGDVRIRRLGDDVGCERVGRHGPDHHAPDGIEAARRERGANFFSRGYIGDQRDSHVSDDRHECDTRRALHARLTHRGTQTHRAGNEQRADTRGPGPPRRLRNFDRGENQKRCEDPEHAPGRKRRDPARMHQEERTAKQEPDPRIDDEQRVAVEPLAVERHEPAHAVVVEPVQRGMRGNTQRGESEQRSGSYRRGIGLPEAPP